MYKERLYFYINTKLSLHVLKEKKGLKEICSLIETIFKKLYFNFTFKNLYFTHEAFPK